MIKMNTPEENILPLIPQRPPFVMIDKLLFCGDTTSRSGLLIRDDNIFVENGEFREPGLVENIAQDCRSKSRIHFTNGKQAGSDRVYRINQKPGGLFFSKNR
ncbi:MAG: hypothetical protein WDO19_16580 [Bacteroidota bacterium]